MSGDDTYRNKYSRRPTAPAESTGPTRTQYKPFAKPTFWQRWFSRQAPGTSPGYEAMFTMIKNGHHDSKAFQFERRYYRLTEEELWAAYEDWCNGRVHPKILERDKPGPKETK